MSYVRVSVNGVHVGSLSTAQYQELRSRPKHDLRVYGAQLVVVCKVLMNLAAYTVVGLPITLVALLVLCVVTPGMVANVVSTVGEYSPEQIEGFVRVVTSGAAAVTCLTLILGCLFSAAARKLIGFRDAFKDESDRLLRVMLEVSASGPVQAFEYVDGDPIREV